MNKQIVVGLDVFSHIWSARLPHELNEDQILARLLNVKPSPPSTTDRPPKKGPTKTPSSDVKISDRPNSKRWTDILIWTLNQHGGRATLAEIYKTSREGRLALGIPVTAEHDASARECLESHCEKSSKYRHKAALFYMPEGKGAGVWALCR